MSLVASVDINDGLRTALGRRAEELVAAFGVRAYRLAFRISGNVEDAEEVVQDAFLSVVRKMDTFRGHSALRSWIYRIVANAAYQKIRRRRDRLSVPLDDVARLIDDGGTRAEDWSAEVDDPAAQGELRRALQSALDELPPDYRTAVVLRDVEGLTSQEIADGLGMTVAAAKTRIHRGRLYLRKRLGQYMAAEI